jgi:hypothetical protein
VFIGFFAFEIQGLGPEGFCSSIMETTLYEKIRSGVLTGVVHGEVKNLVSPMLFTMLLLSAFLIS